jgi:hypothetical protein
VIDDPGVDDGDRDAGALRRGPGTNGIDPVRRPVRIPEQTPQVGRIGIVRQDVRGDPQIGLHPLDARNGHEAFEDARRIGTERLTKVVHRPAGGEQSLVPDAASTRRRQPLYSCALARSARIQVGRPRHDDLVRPLHR